VRPSSTTHTALHVQGTYRRTNNDKKTGEKKTLIPRHSQNASKHKYKSETTPEAEDENPWTEAIALALAHTQEKHAHAIATQQPQLERT
jgi:hypothetical protein